MNTEIINEIAVRMEPRLNIDEFERSCYFKHGIGEPKIDVAHEMCYNFRCSRSNGLLALSDRHTKDLLIQQSAINSLI